MARLLLPVFALLTFLATHSVATSLYYLTYFAPPHGQFTGFSGNMHVPTLPRAGTYYLWPGLQPADGSGVYQEVLDGKSGYWWLAPGWLGSPSLPWGNGFNTNGGDVVTFSNFRGDTKWTSMIKDSTGNSATSTFQLNDKTFTEAIFAIELDGPVWDFRPLVFTDIVITAQGTDTSWCTTSPKNQNTQYAISGVTSSIRNGTSTCSISQLTLTEPM